MAINLVSLVSQFLTPQLVGSLARAVGVNEAVAQKLVAAALPAILAALGTAAAAPGGAQKVSDAISNSDPDLLTKLSGANPQVLNEGANLLNGLLGGSGLSSLVGALSQFAGAPAASAQPLVGAVGQSIVGTIGQQDPSNWSDSSSILALLNSQKSAISAALPPELTRTLSATGLLAGLGGMGAAAAQSATSTVSSTTSAASSAASSAANRVQAASRSSGFPMWAIILIVVVVLVAIYWFMTRSNEPEPAKTGMLGSPAVEYAMRALPGPRL